MNFKRHKPRTKNYRNRGRFPYNPGWFNVLYNTRPKRRRDKAKCLSVMHGADTEDMVWGLPNVKPTVYYW